MGCAATWQDEILGGQCEIPWRIPPVGGDIQLNMSGTDLELLACYTRHRAEDAFAEIVRRHLDLVFSVALRQVRSPQLAEKSPNPPSSASLAMPAVLRRIPSLPPGFTRSP